MDWLLLFIVILLIVLAVVIIKCRGEHQSVTGGSDKQQIPVIHIAGSPGSGKTWLGEYIRRNESDIIVFDTDYFIEKNKFKRNLFDYCDEMLKVSPLDPNVEKDPNVTMAGETFAQTMSEGILKIIERNAESKKPKPIIFTGIPHIVYGDKIFMADIYKYATHKFYIDIHPATLTANVLNRDYIGPICNNAKYRKDLINGKASIQPFSRQGVVSGFEFLKDKYKKVGYKPLHQFGISLYCKRIIMEYKNKLEKEKMEKKSKMKK